MPQDQALEVVQSIETRKKITPRKYDIVNFSKSDYVKFLRKADELQKYKLSKNDRKFMRSQATFPDPLLVRIKEISLFQGTTKNVLLICLQGYKSTMKELNIKYLDIGDFSKFMWPHQVLCVSSTIGVL